MAESSPASERLPEDCDELKTAVAATEESDRGRQRVLIKKSIELGCVDNIPESWEVDIHD